MKKHFLVLSLMLVWAAVWFAGSNKIVESAPVGPQIIIAQLKITSSNGQFITLYNNTTDTIDLSDIQLQYFNNYDLSGATSSKLVQLSGNIPAHGYAVVNDGTIQACYQMIVNSASLGFSSTKGFLQVSHYIGDSPHVVSILDDYVNWSKSLSGGKLPSAVPATVTPLPYDKSSFLQRQAADGTHKYSNIKIPGDGNWADVQELGSSALCDASQTSGVSGGGSLAPGSAPIPYTVSTATAILSDIPAEDTGLKAPEISEVLPNPAPPKTDANDEFVELYNPNSKPFDLSGFILQVGTTTIHKYTFPDGTSIEANKFTAFYSSDTNLSLSNSEGQVELLDPGGNRLGQTDEYTDAKDNYALVKTDGLWQWTITPTPGAANIITPPVSKTSTSDNSSSNKSVLGAATSSGGSSSQNGGSGPSSSIKLHPLVLAGVGAAALLYALYEYRHDLANQLYKFRRNREARRTTGQQT